MKRIWYIGGAALALSSTLAMAQPESLLPDFFDEEPEEATPAPAPAPAPVPVAPGQPSAPDAPSLPGTAPMPAGPMVQPFPSQPVFAPIELPEDFPTLEEIEEMEERELNELFGLRPKYDVPPASRRALTRIGVISSEEGGFASNALARQPAALVRAALEGTQGPLVSRWGHILLRRTLASRINAPAGMDELEFAALRASLLTRMGEANVARQLVQDVDTDNFDRALTDAAFLAYLGSGDLLGMCPITQLKPTIRDDGDWILTYAICEAYMGDARGSDRRLQRALGEGDAAEIDVRLAQRFAGAASEGGRGVTIEWNENDQLTIWRLSLARALGVEIPEGLLAAAPSRFDFSDTMIPAVPIVRRVEASEHAGARGVLSSAAMVDLYSRLYDSELVNAGDRQPSALLRETYVAETAEQRFAAMQSLWGADVSYGQQVLTAYAAARLPVTPELAGNADAIVTSMLSAGLDANAMRWMETVEVGSVAWGQLALAQAGSSVNVAGGDVDSFIDSDNSEDARKSQFLLAGLAGLGRLDSASVSDFSSRLDIDLTARSTWSDRISLAGQHGNAPLVALLAGVGMQGTSWDAMTARHLYHIVSALRAVGLEGEARMIAAEAVARA